ncbi:MAG: hypothetical protein HY696_09785 [Deltaproteobacteria bacterium]|nr:hypothetical protein [Deltaproteobacteria bacterium]
MTKCTDSVSQRVGRQLGVRDTDRDELLLDDILVHTPTAELTVSDAAYYLAQLARCPEVRAQAEPTDPRVTTWSRAGTPWFTLTKHDRSLVVTDRHDGGTNTVSLHAKRFGLLSSLNPWLVRRDFARGLPHPEALRTPEYWIARYSASAHTPLLTPAAIATYNDRESARVVDVDATLTKNGPTLPVRTILAEVLKYYGLELRDGAFVRAPCALGVGSATFTGTLTNKAAELTLHDWRQIVAAMRLPIDVTPIGPPACATAGGALTVQPNPSLDRRIPLQYGVLVRQTELRLYPDARACFTSRDASADDLCTAHRPHLGEPVTILWSGAGWSFVKTQQSGGWVPHADLALATRTDIDRLLTATTTVRDFTVVVDDIRLGMGTRLPLRADYGDTIEVDRPTRASDGRVAWQPLTVSRPQADVAPAFTYASFITALLDTTPQGVWLYANKAHEGTEGVDCSGLVRMALEVHGLIIGRTTGVHFLHAGQSVWQRPPALAPVTTLAADQLAATWRDNQHRATQSRRAILDVLRQWDRDMRHGVPRGPLLLVWPGHVSVFLGFDTTQRPMVFSSLSRSKVLQHGTHAGPTAATEDLWLLGPTVTPLDLAVGVPGTLGRTTDWYARIATIREIR